MRMFYQPLDSTPLPKRGIDIYDSAVQHLARNQDFSLWTCFFGHPRSRLDRIQMNAVNQVAQAFATPEFPALIIQSHRYRQCSHGSKAEGSHLNKSRN